MASFKAVLDGFVGCAGLVACAGVLVNVASREDCLNVPARRDVHRSCRENGA